MSNIFIDEMAVNKSDRTFLEIEESSAGVEIEESSGNMAASITIPFAKVKHLLEGYAAPKRPSRVSPIHSEESALQGELDAWEAASDEAFESAESDLLDQ